MNRHNYACVAMKDKGMPDTNLTTDFKQYRVVLLIVFLIGTLVQITTDIYTPSLPAIAQALNANLGQSQWTMTFFIIGVTVTNLIYGPMSEVIGRRWTLITGIIISLAGTTLCVFAPSIHTFQLGRLIQGCGLGACAALWRSVFRDTFSGAALAQASSYLVNGIVLSVTLAPFIGGYFEHYLGWRATFGFLFFWQLMVIACLYFFFKESSLHHGTHRLKLSFFINTYAELFKDRAFMVYSVLVFFVFGGLFAWLTAGPIILIRGLNVSPVLFGYLMFSSGISMAIGSVVNVRLAKKISLPRIVNIGCTIMFAAGAVLCLQQFLFAPTIVGIVLPAACFVLGTTLIFSNSFALAFEKVGHIAGYAGSLYTSIQQLGGVAFSAILGHLSTTSPLPMALMFIASGALAIVIQKLFANQQ